MLLSGVSHTAHFLLWDPSSTNTPIGAGFGLCYFAIGLLLLRPWSIGLWLGAILPAIGGVFGGLTALASQDSMGLFHAVINWVVFPSCVYLLVLSSASTTARKRVALLVFASLLLLPVGVVLLLLALTRDPFVQAYAENCSVCHGENLEGTPLGTPLVGRDLIYGDTIGEIAKSISDGSAERGMPAWSETLDDGQIRVLAILIAERRADYSPDLKIGAPLAIPEGTIESELHDFRIEIVARDLHPWPFSIAPLPDGRILLTEKTRGLSIISIGGEQSELIQGTPPTHDDGFELASLIHGTGWMMDVALHPEYAENGWIYLHFGDRCSDCDSSMNKLVRGRVEDGRWIDEETIWRADAGTYTQTPDVGAGGRTSFDGQGHVFISVGMKGPSNYEGIQDMSLPYGKIHRVHDDGRIPSDNPFVDVPGALNTTWTYGHRTPQGLEFDRLTGRLWSTEMGPRGGDELNLLLPGRNYGWPLYSKGMDYDGTPVEYGKNLGIALDLGAIEQPVVDMTPSPAVSSFILYRGSAFPEWQNNAIVGTLKATELYRWVLENDRVVHTETLLKGIARIRDVETGPDGAIYLLLEHASGGQIVRLVPG